MDFSDERILANYRQSLGAIRAAMDQRYQTKWAEAIQTWMDQISPSMTTQEREQHARRTIQALGGMESIGEIARTSGDREFVDAVELLYRAAKAVANLPGDH